MPKAKSQQHFLDIQKRLYSKFLDVQRRLYSPEKTDRSENKILQKRRQHFKEILKAVARDALRSRQSQGLGPTPWVHQHDLSNSNELVTSYSKGLTMLGIRHVKRTCREFIAEYFPINVPLISVGCGDARIEQDILRGTNRPFYMVDPAPSSFTGRTPFLPVLFANVNELPQNVKKNPSILAMFWPDPYISLFGTDSHHPPYDADALDKISFDMLITVYSEGEMSGSDIYIRKIARLCRSSQYTILHDQHLSVGDGNVRFLVLIRQSTFKKHRQEEALRRHRKSLREYQQTSRTFPKIVQWRRIVQSKMVIMNDDARDAFIKDVIPTIHSFCRQRSLSPALCRKIVHYVIMGTWPSD